MADLEPIQLGSTPSPNAARSMHVEERNLSKSHYFPPVTPQKSNLTELLRKQPFPATQRARAASISPVPHDNRNRSTRGGGHHQRYNSSNIDGGMPMEEGVEREMPVSRTPQHMLSFMSANEDIRDGGVDEISFPLRSRAETTAEEENHSNPAMRVLRAQQTTTRLLWCLVVMVVLLLGLHLGEWYWNAKKWNESGL